MKTEQWKEIAGYEGRYEVSDQGRVRSLSRTFQRLGHSVRVPERILGRTNVGQYRYDGVTLWKDNKRVTRSIHSLVMETFVGPRPEGMDILHGQLGQYVNTTDNMRYGTRQENVDDMLEWGARSKKNGGDG